MSAVTTPFGLFEFVIMPFGLWNAIQIFQRLMNQVLQDLECCFVYVDDVLVASTDEEQHKKDLVKSSSDSRRQASRSTQLSANSDRGTSSRTRDQQQRYQTSSRQGKSNPILYDLRP